MASVVQCGPRRGKREEMGPEARLSCVYILRGSESGRVPMLPCLPPPTPSFPPSFCWPAPLHASQGRFLPQLGVLGCVAACLYWSVDFLVAACTYLNIPPAADLCSRPRTASPLLLLVHPAHSALSHTLFLLYHSFTAGPLVIAMRSPFFPFSLWPILSLSFLLFPASIFLFIILLLLLLFLMIQFHLHFHPWFCLAVEEKKSRIQWLRRDSSKHNFCIVRPFIICFNSYINSVLMWLILLCCKQYNKTWMIWTKQTSAESCTSTVNIWCILIQVHNTDTKI